MANSTVKESLNTLAGDVKAKASIWSDDLAVPVSNSVKMVQAEFDKLSPSIKQALDNVAPQFTTLTGALTGFADKAMPGVVAASSRLGPVFDGIRGAATTLGAAVGNSFDQISQHSSSLGTSIDSMGRIIATVLNTATPLVTKLSDEFAQHSGEIESAVSALGSTITGLASGAIPALGTALGGDLRILTGFLSALGPADQVLGTLGGTALSAYTNVKLLSNLAGPLDSLAGKLKSAGTEGTTFGTVTTKAGTALEKVGGSLPAIGIALTGISMVMELAAQHGEDLAQAGDNVAKGLQAGGSSAAMARQQLAQWRQDAADAQHTIDQLGQSTGNATAAAGRFGQASSSVAATQVSANESMSDAKTKIQDALDKYNQYTATLGVAAVSVEQLTGKTRVYSSDAQSASSNTSQLKAAMDAMQSMASTAEQKISALQTALAIMGDSGMQKAQDYAAQFGAALDGFSSQVDNAKGSVFGLNGELNTNSERGRDVLQVLEQSQQSWAGQAQSMADAGATTAQVNATLQENQNQLYGVLSAAGLTKDQIQSLLNKYGLIPSNISTRINADTGPAQFSVDQFIRMNNGRQIDIFVNAQGEMGGIASAGRLAHGGVIGAAASGKTLGGGLTIVGEQGPELIRAAAGSTVIPRSGVDRELQSAMGGAQTPPQLTVTFGGNTDGAFATAFMKLVRTGVIQIQSQYVN